MNNKELATVMKTDEDSLIRFFLVANPPGKPGGQRGLKPVEYRDPPNDLDAYLIWLERNEIILDNCCRYLIRIADGNPVYGLITSGFFKPGTTELDPKIMNSLCTRRLDNHIFEEFRQAVLNGRRA